MKLPMALAVVLLLCATAFGLVGTSGYSASALFTESDLAALVSYPAGFNGVTWADMDQLTLGLGSSYAQEGELAANGADLFLVLVGSRSDTTYTGLVRYDGSGFTHLIQDAWDQIAASGEQLLGVYMSPSSVGPLTAGHPIVARGTGPDAQGHCTMELWTVHPTTIPATGSLIHSWADPNGSIQIAIDADGAIYASNWNEIRRLDWNPTAMAYDETFLSTPAVDYALTLGPDGALYALEAGINWGGIRPKTTGDILRIDPDTGATTVYARIELDGGFFRGMAVDDAGNHWIGFRDSRNGSYVIPLEAGDLINRRSAGSRIAEADPGLFRNFVARGANGELYALEWGAGGGPEVVSVLTPGSGGGSGGGGGKGGGKGKKK